MTSATGAASSLDDAGRRVTAIRGSASRLVALDGMRGVAAVVVVLWHFATIVGREPPTAMMAVDLFFLISGFVIPYAYERKLRADMSLATFLKIRLVRLYPLYILGVAISLAPYLYSAATAGPWVLRRPLYWLIWATALLPCVPSGDGGSFLLNPPAWSLFLEIVINVGYAAALPRLSTPVLRGVCIASTAAFAVLAAGRGTFDFGAGGWALVIGLVRVAAPFSLGALLYRRWPSGWRPRSSVWSLAPPLAFVASILMPTGTAIWGLANVAVIMVVFPILVMLAVSSRPTGAAERALRWLGEMSFPLYALHIPILVAAQQMAPAFGFSARRAAAAALPLVFAAAFASIFVYDRPIRLRLERVLNLRRREVDAAPPL